jgi:hypothetical protein
VLPQASGRPEWPWQVLPRAPLLQAQPVARVAPRAPQLLPLREPALQQVQLQQVQLVLLAAAPALHPQ